MNIFTAIFVTASIILLLIVVREGSEQQGKILNCSEKGGILVRVAGSDPYICIDKSIILR
jgi:hypothetical protein